MPQKNTSVYLTLLASIFMMMFVASLFHLPDSQNTSGLLSNFFASAPSQPETTSGTIPSYSMSYLPQE